MCYVCCVSVRCISCVTVSVLLCSVYARLPHPLPPFLCSLVDACLSLMEPGPAKRKCGGAVIDPAHAAPGAVIFRASKILFLFFFGGGVG